MEEDEADAKKQPEAGEDEGGWSDGGRKSGKTLGEERRPVTVAEVRSDIILYDTRTVSNSVNENVNVSTMFVLVSCPL